MITRVRVAAFSISVDGFGAGPDQSLQDPIGKRGIELHTWYMATRSFRAMHGQERGADGVGDQFADRAMDNFGAFIGPEHVWTRARPLAE